MLDELIAVLRAGGSAAAPLAVGSWGFYYLPIALAFPAPYGEIAPWLCLFAVGAGVLAASVKVVRAAL
jgi:hypothetical protein